MSDERWMDHALALARRVLGTTAPNPAVGAVIVRDGVLLGEGSTRPVGGAHAEVVALEAAVGAGHDVRGATMYVTLEPCCHHGRTPPCTEAILAAGISRVVVGVVDAFPLVRGEGLRQLRDAGVEVDLGCRALDCARQVVGFTRVHEHGLPEVSAKAAISVDGRIATRTGESRWISGEPARRYGHRLRSEHDAILVGLGTVLADDPRLTCRIDGGHHPVPVVLDTDLRIPATAAMLHGPRRAIAVCADDAPNRELNAEIVRVPRANGGVDVIRALEELGRRGLHRVLVEGGARVHRTMLDLQLVDTLVLVVAGVVIPGGIPWIGGEPVDALGTARRLGRPEVTRLGDDVVLAYALPHRTD